MAALRILIAEDDTDDYLLLKEAFDQFTVCDITHVEDGQFAVDYLKSVLALQLNLPDIILLDLNMPRVEGLETLRWIKSTPILSPIPVVIHSTATDKDCMRQCFQLGANVFSPKGNSFESVTSFVKNIMLLMRELGVPNLSIIKDTLPVNQKFTNFIINNKTYEYKDSTG